MVVIFSSPYRFSVATNAGGSAMGQRVRMAASVAAGIGLGW